MEATSSLKDIQMSSCRLDSRMEDLLLLAPEGEIRENLGKFIREKTIEHRVIEDGKVLLEFTTRVSESSIFLKGSGRPVILIDCRYFGGQSTFCPSSLTISNIAGMRHDWAKHIQNPEEIFPGMDKTNIDRVVAQFLEKIKLDISGHVYISMFGFVKAEILKLNNPALHEMFELACKMILLADKYADEISKFRINLLNRRRLVSQIITDLRDSKQFAKSKLLKNIRLQMEDFIEEIDAFLLAKI